MRRWFEIDEIVHDRIQFAVIIAKRKGQFIIVFNNKRIGWELPGGNKEAGETILKAAGRELFEETGAIKFDLTPFGIYEWKEVFGMVFLSEVIEMVDMPKFEIEEIKFVDSLPEGMNFGDMFYVFEKRWNEVKGNNLKRYSVDIDNLDELDKIMVG
jgi:ADP-ribose pyrophosphatase